MGRHDGGVGDVAIKGRASGSSHGLSALIPRGRNGRGLRFPIELLFREDPVRRFGQMAGHGPDGFLVAVPSKKSSGAINLRSAH